MSNILYVRALTESAMLLLRIGNGNASDSLWIRQGQSDGWTVGLLDGWTVGLSIGQFCGQQCGACVLAGKLKSKKKTR